MKSSRTHVNVLPSFAIFPIRIPCCIRVSSTQRNHMYSSSITGPDPELRGYSRATPLCNPQRNDLSGQRCLVYGFPHGLGILRRELYPSAHIRLEALQISGPCQQGS